MPVAYLQEFAVEAGDRSTTNYDSELDLKDVPDGLLIHTAGFDDDAGVFRIFDVWATREQGDAFISERLNPIRETRIAAAQESGSDMTPPIREGWYDLHDTISA